MGGDSRADRRVVRSCVEFVRDAFPPKNFSWYESDTGVCVCVCVCLCVCVWCRGVCKCVGCVRELPHMPIPFMCEKSQAVFTPPRNHVWGS
jgi:hypothetical protein